MAIFWLITLVVLGTTAWVTYDAHTNEISMSSKQAYGWNSGALAWCIGCLLLWIVFFPAYLVRRSKTMAERSAARPATTMTAAIAGPTKYCHYCGQVLPADASFCSRCGRATAQTSTPAT